MIAFVGMKNENALIKVMRSTVTDCILLLHCVFCFHYICTLLFTPGITQKPAEWR